MSSRFNRCNTLKEQTKMQRLATLATLALASHGARLGAPTASHGSPAEAEQLTLAELLSTIDGAIILGGEEEILDEMMAQENSDASELAQ